MSETREVSAEEAAELVVHCFVQITKTAEMLLDMQDSFEAICKTKAALTPELLIEIMKEILIAAMPEVTNIPPELADKYAKNCIRLFAYVEQFFNVLNPGVAEICAKMPQVTDAIKAGMDYKLVLEMAESIKVPGINECFPVPGSMEFN